MITEKHKHTRIPQSKFVCTIADFILGNPLRRLTMNPFKVLTRMGVHRGLDILEVGCGPGHFTAPAAKITEDVNVYALDLSPFMIKNVKKKVEKHGLENVKTITSTANNTGLDDESIDLVLCIDVLSDVTDLEDTLREMHRILKSDGTLSVFEPHAGF